MKISSTSRWLLACLALAILTVFLTAPVVLHLRTSIPGGLGDGLFFIWSTQWYQDLLQHWHSPFVTPMVNYPDGWHLLTNDTAIATTFLGIPASLFLGPVAGYNLAMLLTFFLSGLAMLLWVRQLSGSTWAGLAAGTAFAFLPNRMAHYYAGHQNLMGTAWFPLFFMALFEVLREDRPEKRPFFWPPLLGGVSLGLIAWSSLYYLLFTGIAALVFTAAYLLFSRRRLMDRRLWVQLLLTGAVSAPLLLVVLKPTLELSSQASTQSASLAYISSLSASPTDYLLPPENHLVLGPLVKGRFDRSLWMEASLYLGIPILALAAAWFFSRKSGAARSLARASLVTAAVLGVLSLGPYLRWDNRILLLPTSTGGAPIKLPMDWLISALPFLGRVRTLARVGIFPQLFVCLTAGMGAAGLLKRFTGWKQALLGLGLLLAVLVDLYPGSLAPRLVRLPDRSVDRWLASQPGNGALVQMPIERSNNQLQLYFALTHHKPLIGGHFNTNYIPLQYQYLRETMTSFPDDRTIARLQSLGVEYLLIEPRDYPDFSRVERVLAEHGIHPSYSSDGVTVFVLPKE